MRLDEASFGPLWTCVHPMLGLCSYSAEHLTCMNRIPYSLVEARALLSPTHVDNDNARSSSSRIFLARFRYAQD